MAKPLPNSFQGYELSEAEQIKGKIFNQHNLYYLQSILAQFAESKLTMRFDTNSVVESAAAEAELHGKISFLSMLIEDSINETALLYAPQPNSPNSEE